MQQQKVPPYHALAAGYDIVMAHVDYESWAEFVHRLLWKHHPGPQRILELGCGTGSFSLALQPLGDYTYAGTDRSETMIFVAREKAAMEGIPIQFETSDFVGFRTDTPVDVVLLLYDGVNYLLEENEVAALLRSAYRALDPGGLFIFDISTPANSINNAQYFNDEDEVDGFAYVRRSTYDAKTRIHKTHFDMTIDGTRFEEDHLQRAYTFEEITAIVENSPFELIDAIEEFKSKKATSQSERIHWILRKA